MFQIDHRAQRSIEMKKALNQLVRGNEEQHSINHEVTLWRSDDQLFTAYEDQIFQISLKHIDMGFWYIDIVDGKGTDTAKSRILDALNTVA